MKPRILIIEDDPILGDILRNKMNSEGYEATLCTDGGAGLKAITAHKPDLVLLDIVLPTMNGYEILEAKKSDSAIRDIPVIVVSNSGQPVELERTLALGAKDYFIKAQFDPDEILEKVRAQLPNAGTSTDTFKGKKVLVVEDDKFLSELLLQKLSGKGCIVMHATTGEDALQQVTKERPDVVLLDLVLPGMNGFDVLNQIKSAPESKNVQVIVLSNLGQKEDKDRAEQLGASKFMIKAMTTPSEIFSEVATMLA